MKGRVKRRRKEKKRKEKKKISDRYFFINHLIKLLRDILNIEQEHEKDESNIQNFNNSSSILESIIIEK